MRTLVLYIFILLLTATYSYSTVRLFFDCSDKSAVVITDEMDCEDEKEETTEKAEKDIFVDDHTSSLTSVLPTSFNSYISDHSIIISDSNYSKSIYSPPEA
ncbi:MAG: hypothetical protein H0X46_08630 [Bacteroidetes bacterium]|nr:hypothetical protein [Bacteroidota bacterium]